MKNYWKILLSFTLPFLLICLNDNVLAAHKEKDKGMLFIFDPLIKESEENVSLSQICKKIPLDEANKALDNLIEPRALKEQRLSRNSFVQKRVGYSVDYSHIDQFLKNYKKLSLDEINAQMEKFVKAADLAKMKKLAKKERVRYQLSHKIAKLMEKAFLVLLIDGPTAPLGFALDMTIQQGLELSQHTYDWMFNDKENHNLIKIKELLPPKSKKVAFTRGASGGLLMIVGAGGIVAAVFTAGTSGLITGPVGAGVVLSGVLVEQHWGAHHDRSREVRRASHRAQINTGRNVGRELSDLAHENIPHQVLENVAFHHGAEAGGFFKSLGTIGEAGALMAIPIYGGARQMLQGLSMIIQAFAGWEKNHEFLYLQEEGFKKIVTKDVEDKKKLIIELLFESDPGPTKVNDLCQAYNWLENFQLKAEKQFKAREKYLLKIIHQKKIRKAVKYKIFGNPHKKRLKEIIREIDEKSFKLRSANKDLMLSIKKFNPQFEMQSLGDFEKYQKQYRNFLPEEFWQYHPNFGIFTPVLYPRQASIPTLVDLAEKGNLRFKNLVLLNRHLMDLLIYYEFKDSLFATSMPVLPQLETSGQLEAIDVENESLIPSQIKYRTQRSKLSSVPIYSSDFL